MMSGHLSCTQVRPPGTGTETLRCPLTFSVSLRLSYILFPRTHSIRHTQIYTPKRPPQTYQNGEGNDEK